MPAWLVTAAVGLTPWLGGDVCQAYPLLRPSPPDSSTHWKDVRKCAILRGRGRGVHFCFLEVDMVTNV